MLAPEKEATWKEAEIAALQDMLSDFIDQIKPQLANKLDDVKKIVVQQEMDTAAEEEIEDLECGEASQDTTLAFMEAISKVKEDATQEEQLVQFQTHFATFDKARTKKNPAPSPYIKTEGTSG